MLELVLFPTVLALVAVVVLVGFLLYAFRDVIAYVFEVAFYLLESVVRLGVQLTAEVIAIVLERPPPTVEHPKHLSLDKAYDNPTGRRAAAEHGYIAHIRCIGEEKWDALPRPTLGGGTCPGLAEQVSGHPGTLRQEVTELPWAPQASLRPALVSAVSSPGCFDIVSEGPEGHVPR